MKNKKKSEAYKKAYERADRLFKTMPYLAREMYSPDGEPPEQKQAFEDRFDEYKIEEDCKRKMSRKKLMKKYGSKLIRYEQSKSKDIDRTID